MKIVLFRSVDNLGAAGEVVDVKPGYFRNYLGPRGYARAATNANLALMQSRRKKIEAMVIRERSEATAAAGVLTGIELKYQLRANEKGQLFGSITTTDVAKSLKDLGHEVDRRKIEMAEHVKTLGTYPVRIRLYPEVYAEVKVTVERLLRPEEIEAAAEDAKRNAAKAAAQEVPAAEPAAAPAE